MEYSIQQLARLSGVSPRTLRWYHQIGLLTPSRVAESGYRYYGPAQVDRLQHILFFRALGVGLEEIRACLDHPDFHRLDTLRRHLSALEEEQRRLDRLIQTVKETIQTEERNEIMNDAKKFEAFKKQLVDRNEASYGAEARARYGDAPVDQANAALMHLTPAQYQEWAGLGQEIQDRLEAAVRAGLTPDGEEGKAIAALHRRWLTLAWNRYAPAMHRGVVELYVTDDRFAAHYDREIPGCARFLRDAVCHWIS